jgi:hypothetical protein
LDLHGSALIALKRWNLAGDPARGEALDEKGTRRGEALRISDEALCFMLSERASPSETGSTFVAEATLQPAQQPASRGLNDAVD